MNDDENTAEETSSPHMKRLKRSSKLRRLIKWCDPLLRWKIMRQESSDWLFDRKGMSKQEMISKMHDEMMSNNVARPVRSLFSSCCFAFRVENRETYWFLAENRNWVADLKCKKAKGFFSPSESEWNSFTRYTFRPEWRIIIIVVVLRGGGGGAAASLSNSREVLYIERVLRVSSLARRRQA